MPDYYDGKYGFFPEPGWKTEYHYRFYNLEEDAELVREHTEIEGNPDEVSRLLYDVSDPIGPEKTVIRKENPSIEISGYVRKIIRK